MFKVIKCFLVITLMLTALKRHLCGIESEKRTPEHYPSVTSNNFFKEYKVCDLCISVSGEGKGPMRNSEAFVKTHLPGIFLQLLL